jgi:hypothetical protein
MTTGCSRRMTTGCSRRMTTGWSRGMTTGCCRRMTTGCSCRMTTGCSRRMTTGWSRWMTTGCSRRMTTGWSRRRNSLRLISRCSPVISLPPLCNQISGIASRRIKDFTFGLTAGGGVGIQRGRVGWRSTSIYVHCTLQYIKSPLCMSECVNV